MVGRAPAAAGRRGERGSRGGLRTAQSPGRGARGDRGRAPGAVSCVEDQFRAHAGPRARSRPRSGRHLASGTELRRHQIDALAGMLTELISRHEEHPDGSNGNGSPRAASSTRTTRTGTTRPTSSRTRKPKSVADPGAERRFRFRHPTASGKTIAAGGLRRGGPHDGRPHPHAPPAAREPVHRRPDDRGLRRPARASRCARACDPLRGNPITIQTYAWFARHVASLSRTRLPARDLRRGPHGAGREDERGDPQLPGADLHRHDRDRAADREAGLGRLPRLGGRSAARRRRPARADRPAALPARPSGGRDLVGADRRRRLRPGGARQGSRPRADQPGGGQPVPRPLRRDAGDRLRGRRRPRLQPRPGVPGGRVSRPRPSAAAPRRSSSPRRLPPTSAARSTCSSTPSCSPRAGTRRARRVCMHLAPTASRRVYQQRIGRIMRIHPRKEAGVVVDFVDPAATHNERTITLHSLLDSDFYRPGARVTPAPRRRMQRRARRKLSPATWLVPVTPDPRRRLAVIGREWQRVDPSRLADDEQELWARIAGRQLRFDERQQFAEKLARASRECREVFLDELRCREPEPPPASRRRSATGWPRPIDRASFDDLVTIVTSAPTWEKDRVQGVRVLLRALAEGKAEAPEEIVARWTWRLARATRKLQDRRASAELPDAKRLLGALANSRGHRHEENAARLVNVALEQPSQVGGRAARVGRGLHAHRAAADRTGRASGSGRSRRSPTRWPRTCPRRRTRPESPAAGGVARSSRWRRGRNGATEPAADGAQNGAAADVETPPEPAAASESVEV